MKVLALFRKLGVDYPIPCAIGHIAFVALVAISGTARADCFAEAAQEYAVPEWLLRATAQVESRMKPDAQNGNSNGSVDYGLMQINSSWLPTLAKYGISRDSLFDACTNVRVGAWVHRQNIDRLGWSWDAIGAYNVGCGSLDAAECARRRRIYADKIYSASVSPQQAISTPATRSRRSVARPTARASSHPQPFQGISSVVLDSSSNDVQ
ncbi:lytic transglycosylase domain-containing protein [Burkholderia cepacia]|uniref:lytic transglycosylase domain-containing protein n=1 Tax=Burkholderia cepacia TaxID=292 RepID=UPI0038BC979D